MRTILTAALAATLLSAGPALATCDPGELVLKFSHVVAPKGHPKGDAAQEFANRVNAELDGRACMEVHANSTLFSDDDVLPALIAGEVHFAAPSLSKFEAYTKAFRIFDLPFLFADVAAVERFQTSPAGEALKTSMRPAGLLGLTYWHNGMKQLSATRPLLVPQDAVGLRFRIQASDVLQAQIEALDAVPVKLAFKDVAGALADGRVDGQENTWSNIHTQAFHKHQDGVTESNHGIIDYLVVTSAPFWEGLEPALRADLDRILTEVTHEYNRFSFEINELAKLRIQRSGSPVRTLTEPQRQAWIAAFRPVWDRFGDEIGRDLIESAAGAGQI